MATSLKLSTSVLVLIMLFCSSATLAGRFTKLNSITGFLSSSSANDTICESAVETQGYLCQEHKVITEDGYILSMQRMPVARSGKPADKAPVLLQHGLMADGTTWLINSPDESLAFILADNGYDVWIANNRGTRHSRRHTSLNLNDSAYWNWSWDELSAYDLPATFQYVYEHTGQKFHYVGYSLGALTALAAFSQRKLINKLRSAALLGPIAYLNQIPPSFARSAADLFLADDVYWLGLHEFYPGGPAFSLLLENICNKPGGICSNLMNALTGPNCCLNSSTTDAFIDNQLQPTATKTLIHLAQMIRTGNIEMYDYGNEEENTAHYRQPTPPVYNMTSIPNDVPLFLGYGGKDHLSDLSDVKVLLDNLKHHDPDKLVLLFRPDYAHIDFVGAVNANRLVYDPLMAFFNLN